MAARTYVVGPTHPNTKPTATFETKPTPTLPGGRYDTGGGYERWRSTEYRPHTPGDRKKGRVYGITDRGEDCVDALATMGVGT